MVILSRSSLMFLLESYLCSLFASPAYLWKIVSLCFGLCLSWAMILTPVKVYFMKGCLLEFCPSEFLGSLARRGFLVGFVFLLTCSLISKACDLADRLGLSFVVLLSLFTDYDFFSSFFVGILGSIPQSTALILLI